MAIGFVPTPEQAMLQRSARDYAARELRPLVERVRREGVPADSGALVRPVYERGVALGLTRLLVPEERGGLGLTCLDAVLALEELGDADVGLAADLFALNMTMPLMLLRGGGADGLLDAFVEAPAMVLAGAQSEPDVAGSELMMGAEPAHGPRLGARREDDAWVLQGAKSAFITNAGLADHFVILARTAPERPAFEGLTAFHVPRGAPGLRVGRRTELIGWPLSQHAELGFEGVRVPAGAMIGSEGGAGALFAQLPEMPICLAACFVGLARAACEYALDYAKTRRSGGRAIGEHQAVALKLAEMAVELQAARLLVWDAAAACATDPMAAATLKAPAAKTKAVDVAIRNAQLCVEILGGYGVAREYEAGRFLNDAWVGYACDFTRDVLRLGMARWL